MLTLAELGAFIIEHHTRDLFRLETRDRYSSLSDGDLPARYHRGDPEPPRSERPWLKRLADDLAAGRRWRKVHVVCGPLSAYECFEFEWAFRNTVEAGEDVRIHEVAGDAGWPSRIGDYFVLDDRHVILSHYDDEDRHRGAEVVTGREATALMAVRDLVWSAATPFTDWWAAHPQFHRAA